MNRICLLGRIANDLELRCTGQGKDIVSYSLAVRRDKDNTDFIPCSTFGEYAKVLCQYAKKGDMIGVEGRLQVSQYEKEGKKYNSYSVITDKIDFTASKTKEEKQESKISLKQDEIVLQDSELPF